jgi:hypothetical protein
MLQTLERLFRSWAPDTFRACGTIFKLEVAGHFNTFAVDVHIVSRLRRVIFTWRAVKCSDETRFVYFALAGWTG